MNWLILCRMLGLLGMLVGGSMVFSLPWAFPLFGQTDTFESNGFWGLVEAILCSLAISSGLYYLGRQEAGVILRKEALATVGLGWLFVGILGSLPFLFSRTMRAEGVPMGIPDALFESISGFTTTGASVLTQLEGSDTPGGPLVPRCVLFWRCFTQWLGGMGIIVLFVAILGQLGAGGKALMRREVPGPIAETVRPRVRETATIMWTIYVTLSAVLMVVLVLEGMSVYDAFCHAFTTMATGGFSTYNRSLGHFNSPLIEGTVIVFMVFAGTNFALYYLIFRKPGQLARQSLLKKFNPLLHDPEYRVYISIFAVATAALTISLLWNRHYTDFATAFRYAAFQAVAIMTTTGFATADYHQWSEFSKGLLLLLMFIGGSAGSTAGGMKVVRFILFAKVIRLEIEQAFRPNLIRPIRIGGTTVENSLRHEVVVYFSLVLLIFVSSWMLLAAIEPAEQWLQKGQSDDQKLLDCASAVATTLNNVGPGVGILGPSENFSDFSPQGKLLLSFLMLLGRLELFPILVLLIPAFWRSQ